LLEPVAVAVHLQDVDVMGYAVEQSACERFGAEHLGPFLEGQVAGHQRRRTFIALTESLEKQFGAGLGERDVPQFIDDEKFVAGQQLLEAQQVLVVASFDQLADQRSGGGDPSGY
jgi:hypothetical protein